MPVFACPKCNTPLQLPDQLAGKMFACPRCGQQLVIPSAGQSTGVQPPAGSTAGPGPGPAFQAGPPPDGPRERRPAPPPMGERPRDRGHDEEPRPRRRRDAQDEEVGTLAATSSSTSWSKPLLFGLMGALGCFVAAVLICGPHLLIMPPELAAGTKAGETPPVDVMIVLDTTGSMQFAIDGVRDGIKDFVGNFKKEKLDVQVGLTVFRDWDGPRGDGKQPNDFAAGIATDPWAFKFPGGKYYTGDPEEFHRTVGKILAQGGGDLPENSFEALRLAAGLETRKGAVKVLILITDATPLPHPNLGKNFDSIREPLEKTKAFLIEKKVRQLHLIIGEPNHVPGANDLRWCYEKLWDTSKDPPVLGGKFFDLNKIANRTEKFDRVLDEFKTSIITEARRGFTSAAAVGEFEPGTEWRSWIATSLLFAFLAFGLALALIVGQRIYMRQSLLDGGSILKALAALGAGLIGGFLIELVVTSIPGMHVAVAIILRTFGWALIGAIIGLSMALFVPNLKWYKGLLGGVIGGFAGGLLFSLIALLFMKIGGRVLGTLLGDFIGGIVLGFCIGVMVALAEVAFRRWWLEIRYGARETRTVTLGTAPVTVGSDERRATVVVRDVPALVMRYRLDQERIVCEDLESGKRMELEPGDSRKIGNVTITVCSPETVAKTGLMLELSNGQKVPLSDGLPLTAEDLPGLQSNSPDGTVALVGKKPSDPSVLLLRNRSKQSWTVVERGGGSRSIDPGLGLPLEPGVEINFGRVQGRLVKGASNRRRR